METDLGTKETRRLIAADKVEGSKVKNAAGDSLGTIDNVMMDKASGKVAYAVMSFGGFLGIGERYHAVPWSLLKYDTEHDAYIVNLDKDSLNNAPSFGRNETVSWGNSKWDTEVHDYYKVPPYWM